MAGRYLTLRLIPRLSSHRGDVEVLSNSDEPVASNGTSPESTDHWLHVSLALALVALAAPHIVLWVCGVYWAVLVGLVVWIAWFATMPTTCVNGGFIFSLVGMSIALNATGLALLGVVKFVVSLVS